MTVTRIQEILWWAFLAYYTISKYLAGAPEAFSAGYLFSVLLLVILSAVIPWYAARFAVRRAPAPLDVFAALILPLLLSLAGFAVYFYAMIAPNVPGMAVGDVLPRAYFPGGVMAVLLLIPKIKETLTSKGL